MATGFFGAGGAFLTIGFGVGAGALAAGFGAGAAGLLSKRPARLKVGRGFDTVTADSSCGSILGGAAFGAAGLAAAAGFAGDASDFAAGLDAWAKKAPRLSVGLGFDAATAFSSTGGVTGGVGDFRATGRGLGGSFATVCLPSLILACFSSHS